MKLNCRSVLYNTNLYIIVLLCQPVALDRGGCSQDWLHNTPVYSVRVSFTSEFTKIKINEGLLVAFVNQFQFLLSNNWRLQRR